MLPFISLDRIWIFSFTLSSLSLTSPDKVELATAIISTTWVCNMHAAGGVACSNYRKSRQIVREDDVFVHKSNMNGSMALSPSKRVRRRKVDDLNEILKAIEGGNLSEFKHRLKDDPAVMKSFKQRLKETRVSKNSSPLVVAVLNKQLDLFKYILDNFDTDIEQETSAVIEGGYPVEGATALWTASTLGYLDFVKELVSRGADIEHTTDSKSSPLRGAAFDGHCEVCEFLIGQGANIDKPNQVGQSPLTIAAAMQKTKCVELLIAKGADVNHKGHNGDTPLHVSVESGAVEIAKILVKAGAKNDPNDVGFTPAILACCYGHDDVMFYLRTTFHLKPKELYDCYCLLAAKDILGGDDVKTEKWLKLAIQVRRTNPDLFVDLKPANVIYDGLQEPTTNEDIQHILQDETRMFFVSSIFCERVLGRIHPTTAFYIRISGDMALAEERFDKCVELWQRSLDFDHAARMAYELQITEDLLFAIRGFSFMADHSYIPPVAPHFRWGLKEFSLAHESKISEIGVISCLFRMIAAWIKVADSIKEPKKQEKENELISDGIQDLIKVMEDNHCPLLIACLQNIPQHSNGAGKDIINAKLPLHKAIALLLDLGCSVHCEDEGGNFPLHLAVKLHEDTAPHCIKTLLEYGAHLDAVNFDGKTALDLASEDNTPRKEVRSELQKSATQFLSLQCLASRAVVKYCNGYASILPPRLIEYVSWHEGDESTSEEKEQVKAKDVKRIQNGVASDETVANGPPGCTASIGVVSVVS